jgi:hypothetical protein
LGPPPIGTGTIALDPTFGSFTLLDRTDFTLSNWFLCWKCLDWNWFFLVFRVWTQHVDVQHLIYWLGQRVYDALFWRRKLACWVGHVTWSLYSSKSLHMCWGWTKNSESWHHWAYSMLIVERHNHCFCETPLVTPHGALFGTLSQPLLWASLSMVVKGCQTVHLWLLWALFGKLKRGQKFPKEKVILLDQIRAEFNCTFLRAPQEIS